MLTVDEALDRVLQHAEPLAARDVELPVALGRILAEDVASDVDSPPHDKSLVDGYAVRSADLPQRQAHLEVLEEVIAGAVPSKTVGPGQATRIMTGAPIPEGSDAVVMVEYTRTEGNQVVIDDRPVAAGQNILRRAASMSRGEIVLRAGCKLRHIEIGLLAEVGRAEVEVVPAPRVAVLSTGNELVACQQTPGRGQIRNSNGPMLAAAVTSAGGVPVELGIARDEAVDLHEKIARGLKHDVLLLSGGVSAGVKDLVPSTLADLGVQQVFHKVQLKPGKPLWFGIVAAEEEDGLVFGLPGNPVSSLVCFELFVRPALAKLRGWPPEPPATCEARLEIEHRQRGDRPTYHPAVLTRGEDGPSVRPLRWQGSADLRTLAAANALAYFPPGEKTYAAGTPVTVRPL